MPARSHFRRIAPLALCAIALVGCGDPKKPVPPLEFNLFTPYQSARTLAVAPAINLSGSQDFDTLVVADTLYAELQQVEGLNVLPLNKTILIMQRLGIPRIDDVKQAQAIAEALGADGLVIPAITAYDPYNPPTVGMILQLYTPASAAIAQVEAPRRLTLVQTNPDKPILATDPSPAQSAQPTAPTAPRVVNQPVSQVSAVFNGTNQTVLTELAVYARGRSQYDSALVESRFLMDSDSYMRFVCHAMVRRLMDVERTRLSDR